MDLKKFRAYLKTLSIAQLHAIWVMEGERLSADQRILLRKESAKRKRWLDRSEYESKESMWLDDIARKPAEDPDVNGTLDVPPD